MTVPILWLFLAVLQVGLQSVIVVFSDQTHLLSKLDNFRSGSVFDNCFGMHYFVSSFVLQLS